MQDDNKQKRYWVHTQYVGHLGIPSELIDDEMKVKFLNESWEALKTAPGLRYASGQIECCPDTGNLHIQAYTEWRQSLRRPEVVKRWNSSVEWMETSRTACRNYSMKKESRIQALPVIGEWRAEVHGQDASLKAKCIEWIMQGRRPTDIALVMPDAYFVHHRSINALWKALGGWEGAILRRELNQLVKEDEEE